MNSARGRCLSVLLGLAASAGAAELIWGPEGKGGDGVWNEQALGWWDGKSQVAWEKDAAAIFQGTGGTVQISNHMRVSGLTFKVPGYILKGGWLRTAGDFPLQVEADAVLDCPHIAEVREAALIKTGKGKLTMREHMSFQVMEVKEGEVLLERSGASFLGEVRLADAPGVIVTVGSNGLFHWLSGGGAQGGIVRPAAAAAGTARPDRWAGQEERLLRISKGGTFKGSLQDHEAVVLDLAAEMGDGELELTGTNSYSGRTDVNSGTLTLRKGGALSKTRELRIAGELKLDDREESSGDRVPDASPVRLEGGLLTVTGSEQGKAQERTGPLTFTRNARLVVGSNAALRLHSLSAGAHPGTLRIEGKGQVLLAEWDAGRAMLPPTVLYGEDWAEVGSDGAIRPFARYASEFGTGRHVQFRGKAELPVNDTVTAATLALRDGAQVITEKGSVLLEQGTLLSTGEGESQLRAQTLTAATDVLTVIAHGDFVCEAAITGGGSPLGLAKHGAGTLKLTRKNALHGKVTIHDGTLLAAAEECLNSAGEIEVESGRLHLDYDGTCYAPLSGPGVFDIGEHTVTLAHPARGIRKRGGGTLVLNPSAPSNFRLEEGTAAISRANGGHIIMHRSTLVASGRLNSVTYGDGAQISIGGRTIQTLILDRLSPDMSRASRQVVATFDLSAAGHDFLYLGNRGTPYGPPSRGLAGVSLEFRNRGGVTAGVEYAIIGYPEEGPSRPGGYYPPNHPMNQSNQFTISPAAVAAGWKGKVRVEGGTVYVSFTEVPPPQE